MNKRQHPPIHSFKDQQPQTLLRDGSCGQQAPTGSLGLLDNCSICSFLAPSALSAQFSLLPHISLLLQPQHALPFLSRRFPPAITQDLTDA